MGVLRPRRGFAGRSEAVVSHAFTFARARERARERARLPAGRAVGATPTIELFPVSASRAAARPAGSPSRQVLPSTRRAENH